MGLKNWIKNTMHRLGVDIRLAERHDAWTMQQRLLRATTIRTVIDGGGYVGEWTGRYRDAFPQATIHTFEPFPESYKTLLTQFGNDPRVRLNQAALGREPGQKTLFVNQLVATSSLLPVDPDIRSGLPDPEWVAPREQIPTQVRSLDEYCTEAAIDAVQLLKLDIQGGELAALQGSANLLQRGAIDVIYTEMLFAPHYIGQAYHFELCEYLHRFGYHLFGIYNLFVHGSGKMIQADGIFVNDRLWKTLKQ